MLTTIPPPAQFRMAAAVLFLLVFLTGTGWADPAPEITESAGHSAYDRDLAAFKRLRGRLLELSVQVRVRTDLFGKKPSDDTILLRPETRQQILSIWYQVVDSYMALDALSAKYSRALGAKSRKNRRRAFHLHRAVFLTQYRAALDLIAVLEQNTMVDRILNEADGPTGVPQGLYDIFKYQYLNVIKAGRYAAMAAVAKAYQPPGDDQLVKWAAEDSRIILNAGKGPGPIMTFKNGLAIVQQMGRAAWFPVQKGVAEWMGHTKVYRPHQYLITAEQVQALSPKLEPGDILLERREWYMTNVGIPGFWTHAALYIGTARQREILSREPEVKQWLNRQGVDELDDLIRKRHPRTWEAMQVPYKDGRPPEVIEAIATGVTLTSLSYSATCDSLAVLRPRLSKTDRAAAIYRSMGYHGRPYDYDFDFSSDSSLVCTELVVKSYLPGDAKKGLRLPFERLMGHRITPANAFARHFDQTFATADQQLDLVVFLDGSEKLKTAAPSDLTAFRSSWKRPKWHILVEYAGSDSK